MNILAIGDVVGTQGCEYLRAHLPALKKIKGIDLVIANGENSAPGNGITPASAGYLFDSGVDVITTGNHVFRRREVYEMLDSEECLLRPANYHRTAPGKGICIVDKGRIRVCVINISGTIFMDSLANPFDTADELLKQAENMIVVVDFHAEATSEKKAMAYYLDGRVSAFFGTHTHVQTADERILPSGTGYITDLGMTGPYESVLGVKRELAIEQIRTQLPTRFETADTQCHLCGCIFTIDEKCLNTAFVERICII